ncbi:MAG: metallophosphoesterase [Acetobacter sp.]|nr:metallophosphoesterase [Acetobacter sp.]
MKYLVTGDCHGNFSRFFNPTFLGDDDPANFGVIVLGDFGVNFYLNKTDKKNKRKLEKTGLTFFLVRGNHEARPQHLPNIKCAFNHEIGGMTYFEEEFPHIHYLINNQIYTFGNYTALVIEGAYSVDKWYRLQRAGLTGNEDYEVMAKKAGWFADEQLSKSEMEWAEKVIVNKKVDFVFSHTCPFSWQPFDLFLGGIDQSTVDHTMETWMDSLKDKFDWNIWLFGHFHDDRLERPHVEMYSTDIEDLDVIVERWAEGNQPAWWLKKDPNYYMKGDCRWKV